VGIDDDLHDEGIEYFSPNRITFRGTICSSR